MGSSLWVKPLTIVPNHVKNWESCKDYIMQENIIDQVIFSVTTSHICSSENNFFRPFMKKITTVLASEFYLVECSNVMSEN